HNIASTEPRPPEAIDRDIPGELSAIALTCLEKERGARYESARALADDLDRFLNGEPIRARRAGSWYRLRKRIRKQRGLVAAGTLATVLVIAALAWGLQIRSQAEERERLARRFSERVEQVEAIARYSALSRAHDIRGDRERILARVRELSAEIGVAGPLAAGPGAYAIGRGYMALGDDAKARDALESAWEKGFRDPRAAYALALVTGHLYQRELVEAERIRNDALRAAKKKEIEARYRDPALAYLRKSDGADVPSKEYVAALIAYYEGHFDEALAHVDAIGDALPWFYEAPELRGDVLFARGLAAHRGGDGARAKADFEAGRAAYARACAVAESVPDVWAAAAALEYQDMVLELYGEGDVEPPFARGIAATSRALAVMPDDRASLLLAARLRRSLAEHRTTRGEKVDDLLDSAARDAERAVALSPSDPVARLELSRVHRQRGEAEAALGADPSAALTKALAVVEPVEAADRGYEFQVNLGLVFTVWADHEDEIGASSVENRGKSIDAYLAAIAQDPRLTEAFINLAAAYQERASRAQAKDPDGDLRAAAEALDKALALQPSHVVALYYKGNVHKEIAERLRSHGADAKAELLRAKEAYEAGLAINPKLHYLHNGVGLALTNIARDAWDRGEPAEPLLLQAKAAFERAIAIAPDQSLFRDSLGLAHLARARCVRSLGGDPEEDLASAEAAFKEAVGLHADDALAWAHVAWVHVVRAERALDRATDAAPALASATAAIEKALAANPNEPDAHLALGEIGRLKARALARRGTASEAEYQRASEAYKKSLELAPNDQDARVMIAWFDREWAAWRVDQRRDARPIVDEALDMLAPVLTARPAWADARALRGALLLQRARAANEGAREIATKATEDLDAALQTNPNLERRFRADEIAAKQLTTP
ncbi:MAG: serine/threonine protein kinase, partial [Polyangiaceae bacterium]